MVDFPVIIMASKPHFRKANGKKPPDVDSPHIPVIGEIAVTEYLLLDGVEVPVNGPVAKMMGLDSFKGFNINF